MDANMRVRISAQNDSARGFDEVKRDAVSAANAVTAAGGRAGTAMARLGESSRMAAFQQRNLVFQLNDVAVSLASGMNPLMVFAQQGSQIATIYGPEEGGLGRAFSETGKMALNFAKGPLGLVGLAAAAVAVTVAGLTNEINKTAKTSVSMGDVMLGGFQLLGESIMGELQPAFDWLGGIWDQITPHIKTGVNLMVGAFVKGYLDIKTYWSMLPAALGDVAISTANNILDATEKMINGSLGQINAFVLTAKTALGPIFGAALQPILPVDFGAGIPNPWAGAGDAMQKQLGQNAVTAFGTDWVGEIGKRAESIALLGKETDKAGGAAKRLNDDYARLKDDGLDGLVKKAQELADALGNTLTDGIMSVWKAFRTGGNVLDTILNKVMDLGDQLMSNALQGLFGSLLGGMFGGGMGLGSGAIGRGVFGGMGGFFPAWPGLATGGTVSSGGMALVGENGPEPVYLPRGAQVIPNEAIAGPIVNITINAPNSTRDSAPAIAEAVRKVLPDAIAQYNRNPWRRS